MSPRSCLDAQRVNLTVFVYLVFSQRAGALCLVQRLVVVRCKVCQQNVQDDAQLFAETPLGNEDSTQVFQGVTREN